MADPKRWLRQLQVNRVALVDRGAHPKADVLLWKRDVEKATTIGTPKSPDAALSHLGSAHGLDDVNSNPFARHDKAHADGTFASGQEHTHTDKRDFSADERDAAASEGVAMPDGSFPIKSEADLKNAIRLAGNAKDPAAAKAHIVKRAKALGRTDLIPDSWNVSKTTGFVSNSTNTAGTGGITYTILGNTTNLQDSMEKAGRKISASRMKDLMESRDRLTRIIEEAQVVPATQREEERMPEDEKVALSDEARSALPEEAQKFIAQIEGERDAAVTKTAEPKEDPVLKGLPEEVRTRLEDSERERVELSKRVDEEIAKRQTAEVEKRLETAKAAGVNPSEWASDWRNFEQSSPEFAKKVKDTLDAAAGRIESGDLFSELGKVTPAAGEAIDKLNVMADEMAKNESISKEAAFEKVSQTPEGQRLYSEYTRANERGSN